MATSKTAVTAIIPDAFVAGIADPVQQADVRLLIDLLGEATGEPAAMWGTSIIGFGRYHYRYESGREGDAARVSFAPRKGQIVLYLFEGSPSHADLLARLGTYKNGKSCIYIKRLADIDPAVLRELVAASLTVLAEHYPQ